MHREAIEALLASGAAYYDYTTAAERAAEREAQIAGGQTPRYSGSGRSLTAAQIAERQAAGIAPAVRFGSGSGAVGFDGVFGPLETDAAEIEDFVIARGDGSALYNMAVVATTAMAITHVVRGADHTSNTFRQILLYRALGWEPPRFGTCRCCSTCGVESSRSGTARSGWASGPAISPKPSLVDDELRDELVANSVFTARTPMT